MALSKITAASITDNTITNTQINASAAIAQTKLTPITAGNMLSGSILQVQHNISNSSVIYGGTTSSGHDILNKTVTTKRLNSVFYVHWSVYHGVGGTDNNMDSHDMHLFALRTASNTHAYVGGNASLTRTTAGAPSNQRLYVCDVAFSPSRGLTPDYGNSHDGFNRSGHFLDSPSLAAGVTNQYRIRMFNQATTYINRSRGSGTNAGGVSSLVIMEIAA